MEHLSFGEQLIGNASDSFNIAEDSRVLKAKRLCIELANLVEECRIDSFENGTYNSIRQLLTENAFCEIVKTQLNVVKVITLK